MIYENTLELCPKEIEKINNFLEHGNQLKSERIKHWVHFPDTLVSIAIVCEPVLNDSSSHHSHIVSILFKDCVEKYREIRGKNFTDDYVFPLDENTYIVHIKNKDKQKKHTMKKWTEEKLKENGYEIENVQITGVRLNTKDYCCLTLDLTLQGQCTGVTFGGYVLGKCYTSKPSNKDEDFEGYASGTEAIMRIMSTVGVKDLSDMENKYVRAAYKNGTCKVIGNIIEDVWFDYESFFNDTKEDKYSLIEKKSKTL